MASMYFAGVVWLWMSILMNCSALLALQAQRARHHYIVIFYRRTNGNGQRSRNTSQATVAILKSAAALPPRIISF
jgi:hypothetical protein